MTTTLTSDVNTTLQQIAELTASGCDIVRVACPSQDDAEALPEIAQHSQIPVIADIHFQPKYVFAAIDAGCAAVRVNPGNIRKFDDQIKEIAAGREGPRHQHPDRRQRRLARQAAAGEVRQGDAGGAGRVRGVGGGPLRGARLPRLQDLGQAQRPGGDGACLRDARRGGGLAAAPRRHRGRSRRSRAPSSPPSRSATCCRQGIGDTIRVSLSAPPVEEVKVGIQILESLNLKPRRLEIVSCPSAAAVPRSTSTSSPTRSPPASTVSRCRCASPSWAAS